jgi:hypothetical protein
MTDQSKQMLMELATTVLVLAIYWLAFQPEWKMQMYLKMAADRLRRPESPGGLSLGQKLTLAKFRQEISDWEHSEKERNGLRTGYF